MPGFGGIGDVALGQALRRDQDRIRSERQRREVAGGLDFRGDARARRQIPDEIRRERGAADERRDERDFTRQETLRNIRGFDPQEFANEAAGAQFRSLSQGFDRRLAGRRANLNRRGLFASNIGGSRERRDFNDELANALSANAFRAAELEGQNIDRLGGVASQDRQEAFGTRDRELQLLSGQADREQGRENVIRELEERRRAREAEQKKKGGFFGSLIGGVTGGIFGGPGGAEIGSRIGGLLPF